MRFPALVLVAALLVTGSILFILARPERGDPRALTDGETYARLDARLAEWALTQERTVAVLERLEAKLAGLPAEPTPVHIAPSTGIPLELDDLVLSLDALRVAVEAESERLHGALRDLDSERGPSLTDARERRPEANWDGLEELEKEWRLGGEASTRSELLSSVSELVERYGAPHSIYRPAGSLLFVYRRHEEGGAGPAWYFRIQDGIVVEFWVEDEEVEDS